MKDFSATKYPNGLVIHRDGKYTCQDCDRVVPYDQLQHLDFYSDIGWAQCKECAIAKGEFCAVTQERKPPSQQGLAHGQATVAAPSDG